MYQKLSVGRALTRPAGELTALSSWIGEGPQRGVKGRGEEKRWEGWEEKGRVGKQWERKGMQEKVRDKAACIIHYVPSN